jgi:hypothetical protein
MKQYIKHLVAAQITQKYPNVGDHTFVALITPYKLYDDRMSYYWDNGPSKSDSTIDNEKILHDYGIEDENDYDWWDNVDLHFLTTYYPAKAVEPKPDHNKSWYGWIAPNGDYYMAHYGNHDETARSIVATLEGKVPPGYKAREFLLKTWIQLNDKYISGRYDMNMFDATITTEQIKTIDYINNKYNTRFGYKDRDIVND